MPRTLRNISGYKQEGIRYPIGLNVPFAWDIEKPLGCGDRTIAAGSPKIKDTGGGITHLSATGTALTTNPVARDTALSSQFSEKRRLPQRSMYQVSNSRWVALPSRS